MQGEPCRYLVHTWGGVPGELGWFSSISQIEPPAPLPLHYLAQVGEILGVAIFPQTSPRTLNSVQSSLTSSLGPLFLHTPYLERPSPPLAPAALFSTDTAPCTGDAASPVPSPLPSTYGVQQPPAPRGAVQRTKGALGLTPNPPQQ